MTLESELKELILNEGAVSVGYATKEMLSGGPRTTDMTYVLSEGETAIVFAVPLDKDKIRSYLRKDLPRGHFDHVIDNGEAYFKTHMISKAALRYLESKGHKAAVAISNFKYREEDSDWRIKLPPPLALRLVADRSGAGVIGWSGNVLVPNIGATVLLGGLVTSAKLTPTEPIPPEESPCDKCKLCVSVCAFRMFDKNDEDSYTLGDKNIAFSKRNDVVKCYLVCGGLSGLDKTRKWSTWSSGRHNYPETREELYKLQSHMFTHPIRNTLIEGEDGSFAETTMWDDPDVKEYITSGRNAQDTFTDNFDLTCGNCQLICWGNHEDTAENYKILTNSGCIVKNKEGRNFIVSSDEAEKIEKEVKALNIPEETSERRQEIEKYIYERYIYLRNQK